MVHRFTSQHGRILGSDLPSSVPLGEHVLDLGL